MTLFNLKEAILLEAGFRAFWDDIGDYEGVSKDFVAASYRRAFAMNALRYRARSELKERLLADPQR